MSGAQVFDPSLLPVGRSAWVSLPVSWAVVSSSVLGVSCRCCQAQHLVSLKVQNLLRLNRWVHVRKTNGEAASNAGAGCFVHQADQEGMALLGRMPRPQLLHLSHFL